MTTETKTEYTFNTVYDGEWFCQIKRNGIEVHTTSRRSSCLDAESDARAAIVKMKTCK